MKIRIGREYRVAGGGDGAGSVDVGRVRTGSAKVAPPKAATTEAQLTPAQKEEQERIRIYVNGLQSR